MEIVDAHQHVGGMADALPPSDRPVGLERPIAVDAAERVKMLDAAGISWALLQPSHGYLRVNGIRDTMAANDKMAAYRKEAPDRFRAIMGTVEPLHGEASIAEIERCRNELMLNGISWHHRLQGAFIDSKWMWPYLKRMSDLKLVPLFHVNVDSTMESPWRLQRLARDFPELTFIAQDGLWALARARHIFDTASTTPNIIWDIGGPSVWIPLTEWVKRHGADNICFSADLSYSAGGKVAKPHLLEQIEQAPIPDAAKEKILGGNLKRLFGV